MRNVIFQKSFTIDIRDQQRLTLVLLTSRVGILVSERFHQTKGLTSASLIRVRIIILPKSLQTLTVIGFVCKNPNQHNSIIIILHWFLVQTHCFLEYVGISLRRPLFIIWRLQIGPACYDLFGPSDLYSALPFYVDNWRFWRCGHSDGCHLPVGHLNSMKFRIIWFIIFSANTAVRCS